MVKMDFKKEYKHLYYPSAKEVSILDVFPLTFLAIDGAGDPNNSEEFQTAVDVLYSLSYTIKFAVKKKDKSLDYVVAPLEGLWWTDGPAEFNMLEKSKWQWTLMIAQPDAVTKELLEMAVREVVAKKGLQRAHDARLELYTEGTVAQIMHIGPYANEAPTVEKLQNYIGDNGYEVIGKHHEIYLSDPRRVAPEKMKTVIRLPIAHKRH